MLVLLLSLDTPCHTEASISLHVKFLNPQHHQNLTVLRHGTRYQSFENSTDQTWDGLSRNGPWSPASYSSPLPTRQMFHKRRVQSSSQTMDSADGIEAMGGTGEECKQSTASPPYGSDLPEPMPACPQTCPWTESTRLMARAEILYPDQSGIYSDLHEKSLPL